MSRPPGVGAQTGRESQRKPEKARESQRKPEKARESQRKPEKARVLDVLRYASSVQLPERWGKPPEPPGAFRCRE